MLLYYITDRNAFAGTEAEKRARVLSKIAEAAQCGVNFIQIREKDLSPREFERLARDAVQIIRKSRDGAPHLPGVGRCGSTRVLINSRTDIALAVGADGVHLTSTDIAASEARAIHGRFLSGKRESGTENFLVAVSCHTTNEVRLAESHGADLAVFAPVFEKSVACPAENKGERQVVSSRSSQDGLTALRSACQSLAFPNNVEGVGTSSMPVLALGGVTLQNARDCVRAGAAGIAAIRLFQENDIAEVVRRLRS